MLGSEEFREFIKGQEEDPAVIVQGGVGSVGGGDEYVSLLEGMGVDAVIVGRGMVDKVKIAEDGGVIQF